MEEMEVAMKKMSEIIERLKEITVSGSNEKEDSVDKYVFVPLVVGVNYEYKDRILTLSKNSTTIKIKILDNKHITKIKANNNRVDIRNILLLTGFAINENSLGLVRTLDPCDHVKGILVNGEIKSEQNLSKLEIIYPKANVFNKLYFLWRSQVELQKDIKITLLIDSTSESKCIGKTNYRHLESYNDNVVEEFKRKIGGIAELYGIQNDRLINKLAKELSASVDYCNI